MPGLRGGPNRRRAYDQRGPYQRRLWPKASQTRAANTAHVVTIANTIVITATTAATTIGIAKRSRKRTGTGPICHNERPRLRVTPPRRATCSRGRSAISASSSPYVRARSARARRSSSSSATIRPSAAAERRRSATTSRSLSEALRVARRDTTQMLPRAGYGLQRIGHIRGFRPDAVHPIGESLALDAERPVEPRVEVFQRDAHRQLDQLARIEPLAELPDQLVRHRHRRPRHRLRVLQHEPVDIVEALRRAPRRQRAQVLLWDPRIRRQTRSEVKAPLAPHQLRGAEHPQLLQPHRDRAREPVLRQRHRAVSEQQRLVVGDDTSRLQRAAVHPLRRAVHHPPEQIKMTRAISSNATHGRLLSDAQR